MARAHHRIHGLARHAAALAGVWLIAGVSGVRAGDVLHIVSVDVAPPTVITLGLSVSITDDDDYDASVAVRYRAVGASGWRAALPLWRVHRDVVSIPVAPQFAGSIFELQPGTAYEIELHAVDPDGLDETRTVMAATRPVPRAEPATPHAVAVGDADSLRAALAAAMPGDVIEIADGGYAGPFEIDASGTAENPTVVRGASTDGTVLDGGGCDCNIVEVYGSFVHVERLTLQNASRAIRFQGEGAEQNVLRRVHVRDVVLGVGSRNDQHDFYLCDNVLEGRLTWPFVYTDDGGAHANDDGIHVEGDGHVVCHNRLVGFGDAIKVEQEGSRSFDVYGNEVLSAYDNAVELDTMSSNGRCFRNRFTNTYATISFQPIYGGPVYAFRNVVVNVAHEQVKLHGLGGGEEPSGILILNNTFVSPRHAINLETDATTHHFVIADNLFVGPASPEGGRIVNWDGVIDDGSIDYDGYWPDGMIVVQGTRWGSFAEMMAAGVFEAHGVLLGDGIFASGLAAPADFTVTLEPPDATLAAGSSAIDRGVPFTGVNDVFTGAAPDLGALELGCPIPIYGVRPEGIDESNEPVGCGGSAPPPDRDGGVGPVDGGGVVRGDAGGATPSDAGGTGMRDGSPTMRPDGSTTGTSSDSGCGCRVVERRGCGAGLLLVAGMLAGLVARRHRRA